MMWNLFKKSLVGSSAFDIVGEVWMNVSSFPKNLQKTVVDQKEIHIQHDLKDIVTVLFFWDYSDPASLQDVPYIHDMWERYEGQGFLIIGVHTPQLEMETDPDKVQGAVLRFDLDFPIVSDASYKTWRKYGNKVWPRKIVIDAQGIIQYDHQGEGRMEELEKVVRNLLAPVRESELFPSVADVEHTPDIEFGSESSLAQGIAASPPNDPAQYHMQYKLPVHHYGLSGWWIIQKDKILSGPAGDDQACVVHFLGTAVTLGAVSEEGCLLEILMDSKPIQHQYHGRDIIEEQGRTYVRIQEERGYSILMNAPRGKYILSLIPTHGNISLEACLFS